MPDGTFYIETYGCQMNDHDSEKMAAQLMELGLTAVQTADEADVIIINTCSVREKPQHKVYSALGTLRPLKKRNPGLVTVVAGCVAQQEKERLLKRADHLDIVLGTRSIGRLSELVRQVWAERARVAATEFTTDFESLHMPAPGLGRSPVWSYVTIMQGCSNFCSYCVVPFTRGPEISRPLPEIVDEVRSLVSKGVKEVTLLGQNVNAYGKDLSRGETFVGLLEALDAIEGLCRIRFTTSHPRDFHDGLARAMAGLPAVCSHIHLPLQSGSDRILKAMRRGYTYSEYLEKVKLLRTYLPGVAITADMIVGFPGETEEDLQDTLRALEEIRYDQIFSFKYSPRPGTAAEHLSGQLSEEDKARRLAQVHAVQDSITGRYHKQSEGTLEQVLIEGIREASGQPFGRTSTNKIVNLEAADSVSLGDLVNVRITRGLKHSLVGKKEG